VTTFLNNFSAWQQSVRRQAELIRAKSGITNEPHELAEAVFTAASVIRRGFRDARQHHAGSSSENSQKTKVVNALLSTSEEHVNIGSLLEAYGTNSEVESVTLQTLCDDVVEGADLTISKVPLGSAYGFIVTPSRFPYQGYYVHWKEFEAALVSFVLLDPDLDLGTGVIKALAETDTDELDTSSVVQTAIGKTASGAVVEEVDAYANQEFKDEDDHKADVKQDESHVAERSSEKWRAQEKTRYTIFEDEPDPPADHENDEDITTFFRRLHGDQYRHPTGGEYRYIPSWIGAPFLELFEDRCVSSRIPPELRALSKYFDHVMLRSLGEILCRASVGNVKFDLIREIEESLVSEEGNDFRLAFTPLYLTALLVKEYPEVDDLLLNVYKTGRPSVRFRHKGPKIWCSQQEMETLISILLESVEAGMWQTNPAMALEKLPIHRLTFVSYVSNQGLGVDMDASATIRANLQRIVDDHAQTSTATEPVSIAAPSPPSAATRTVTTENRPVQIEAVPAALGVKNQSWAKRLIGTLSLTRHNSSGDNS